MKNDNKRWTEKEMKKFRRLFQEGKSIKEISNLLQRSERALWIKKNACKIYDSSNHLPNKFIKAVK
jgi:hypothetical protein